MDAHDNHTSRHRETWDLIPWLVNGRCSAQARRDAEEHLAACADCRSELAFQRELSSLIRREQEQDGRNPQPALRRLWARIDAQQENAKTRPALPAPRTDRNNRWYGARLVRGLLAAVAAEALGLAVLGAAFWLHTEQATHYQTLSAPAVVAQRARIRAVFTPTLTLAAMQALLVQEQLQIVAGPDDAGVYLLAPLVAQPGDTLAQTLKRLRARAGVLFAEPVDSGR